MRPPSQRLAEAPPLASEVMEGGLPVEAVKPRRVVFGAFSSWDQLIRPNLAARYDATFADLADVDLDAFDAVAPLRVEHYAALARRPDLHGRKFFHPAVAVAALCEDKLALTRFLLAEGFADFAPPLRMAGAPYPYVWKRRWGEWGGACRVIAGPEAEANIDLADPAWFAQTLVRGETEFATHVLLVDGGIRYASTFDYHMAGAELICGKDNRPLSQSFAFGCDHLPLFAAILDRLGYEGTACFDYKVVAGRPLIFELNPRYGGSLSSDVTAYVDAYVKALRP
jgi:hypothetical protein